MARDYSDTVQITLDVDWAPEHVLESVIGRLREAGVKATFFATHASEALSAAEGEQFEIGLHPNFNDSKGDFETPLRLVHDAYPNAVGGRSHSLYVGAHILEAYMRFGLRYESNIFLLEQAGLKPSLRFAELVALPFRWSDDKHFELRRPFEADLVRLGDPGLKVLNFHPIHVYMNTRDLDHYYEYKPHQKDPDALERFVNRDEPGVSTIFDAVLEEISQRRLEATTMAVIADEYFAGSD